MTWPRFCCCQVWQENPQGWCYICRTTFEERARAKCERCGGPGDLKPVTNLGMICDACEMDCVVRHDMSRDLDGERQ